MEVTRAVHSTIEPERAPPGPGPARPPLAKSDYFSCGLGCLLGLVILLAFSTIGVFGFALVIDAGDTRGWSAAIVSLFAVIGFIVGSTVFLRVTAPSISIRGIGPIPTISINPSRAGTGIQNLAVIRTCIGLIVCVAIYLIFTTWIVFTGDNEGELTRVLFFQGVVLGPILGVLIALRTSIA